MYRKILHKRGLEKNLPQLSPGEFALTTDTNKVFIGTDSENIEVTGSTDAQARQEIKVVNQILNEKVSLFDNKPVNIMKYSHLRNNITGSWSDAIDKAIADTDETGQEIWFPRGIFYVHKTIKLRKNTKIIGSGNGDGYTKIQLLDNSNVDLIEISTTNFSGVIRNMRLAGDYRYLSSRESILKSKSGSGVVIKRDPTTGSTIMNQPDISNLVIEEFPEYGMTMDAKCWVITVQNVDLRRNYKGGMYDLGSDNHFDNLNIYENALLGIYHRSSGNHYSNMKIYLNGRYAKFNPNYATGLVIANCNRNVYANIEIQQSYFNGVIILENTRNIELVNITFDETGFKQIKDPNEIPPDFKPVDLIVQDCVNIRGSNIIFSARHGGNIDHAIIVRNSARDVDIIFDTWDDGTAHYFNEKTIQSPNRINVRSYKEEYFRFLESGNAKMVNKNSDLLFEGTFWSKSDDGTFSTLNGILTMLARAQNTKIQSTVSVMAGRIYAVYVEINAPDGYPLRILANNAIGDYTELINRNVIGTGGFTQYVAFGKSVNSADYLFQLIDSSPSNFKQVSIRNIVILDLTQCFPDISFTSNDNDAVALIEIIDKYGVPNGTKLIGTKAKINHILNTM